MCFASLALNYVFLTILFNSKEFLYWTKELRFKFKTKSSDYAQCNGFVERSVGIQKTKLKRSLSTGKPWNFSYLIIKVHL